MQKFLLEAIFSVAKIGLTMIAAIWHRLLLPLFKQLLMWSVQCKRQKNIHTGTYKHTATLHMYTHSCDTPPGDNTEMPGTPKTLEPIVEKSSWRASNPQEDCPGLTGIGAVEPKAPKQPHTA